MVGDEDGIELAGPAAARRAALAGARALMCDQMKSGRLDLRHRIEVEDEAGRRIFSLPFRDDKGEGYDKLSPNGVTLVRRTNI